MKMKISRALPLFLILILALTASGCPDPDKIASTPEELLEGMVGAIRNVESLKADVEITIDVKTVAHGETKEISSLMQSANQVDLTNERMKTTTMVQFTMPPMPGTTEDVIKMETEMYWIDGIAYKNSPMMPGMPPTWTKAEIPWVCSLDLAINLLEVSQIDILRVEEAHGVESYVINVVPHLGKLWKMIAIRMGADPMAMDFDLEELFEKTAMKTWICRDTFLPTQEKIQATMVIAAMGMERRMEISIITRTHSFNEPVDIELPPEAAGATEIP